MLARATGSELPLMFVDRSTRLSRACGGRLRRDESGPKGHRALHIMLLSRSQAAVALAMVAGRNLPAALPRRRRHRPRLHGPRTRRQDRQALGLSRPARGARLLGHLVRALPIEQLPHWSHLQDRYRDQGLSGAGPVDGRRFPAAGPPFRRAPRRAIPPRGRRTSGCSTSTVRSGRS